MLGPKFLISAKDTEIPWQHIRIARFGGPEVLELVEQPAIPDPGSDEVRIKVFAAGTAFTDTMIRRGGDWDFKGPLPYTPWSCRNFIPGWRRLSIR